jgi:ABC-2 type transport system ATP-binding protein
MIENGKIVGSGKPSRVAQQYRELFMKQESVGKRQEDHSVVNKDIFAKVNFSNNGDMLTYEVVIKPKIDIIDPVITFVINRDSGEVAYRWVSDEKISEKITFRKGRSFALKLVLQNIFPNGVFSVQLGVKKRDRSIEYAVFNSIVEFEIINKGRHANDVHWKPNEQFDVREK